MVNIWEAVGSKQEKQEKNWGLLEYTSVTLENILCCEVNTEEKWASSLENWENSSEKKANNVNLEQAYVVDLRVNNWGMSENNLAMLASIADCLH